MGRKNPDLCQKPYCRERWAWRVDGWSEYFGGRHWQLHVCEDHAREWHAAEKSQNDPDVVNIGARVSVLPRNRPIQP